ncbi:protein MpChromo4 [Marchantia polymorpha subsp. ruderalis]|uniref:Chromo domain-containing protein n=1 Tax=Marchantia polymorpha subsp. ruderalis TaxID=1480154 RepID=A0AAF6BLQ5_MARPO|nr:hypothetical protein Mp_5g24140 [Marchantia polymorpha subsp. ruderalis]
MPRRGSYHRKAKAGRSKYVEPLMVGMNSTDSEVQRPNNIAPCNDGVFPFQSEVQRPNNSAPFDDGVFPFQSEVQRPNNSAPFDDGVFPPQHEVWRSNYIAPYDDGKSSIYESKSIDHWNDDYDESRWNNGRGYGYWTSDSEDNYPPPDFTTGPAPPEDDATVLTTAEAPSNEATHVVTPVYTPAEDLNFKSIHSLKSNPEEKEKKIPHFQMKNTISHICNELQEYETFQGKELTRHRHTPKGCSSCISTKFEIKSDGTKTWEIVLSSTQKLSNSSVNAAINHVEQVLKTSQGPEARTLGNISGASDSQKIEVRHTRNSEMTRHDYEIAIFESKGEINHEGSAKAVIDSPQITPTPNPCITKADVTQRNIPHPAPSHAERNVEDSCVENYKSWKEFRGRRGGGCMGHQRVSFCFEGETPDASYELVDRLGSVDINKAESELVGPGYREPHPVKAIRAKRLRKGRVEYYVKWLNESGFTPATWEPHQNFRDCECLEIFEKKCAAFIAADRLKVAGKDRGTSNFKVNTNAGDRRSWEPEESN